MAHPCNLILPNVTIPVALLNKQTQFSGQRVGDCLTGDVIMRHGRVAGMRPCSSGPSRPRRLLFPLLTEPHCHLDKCHTIDRMPHSGGDLAMALSAQRKDKARWTEADIRTRAGRGLAEAAGAGCGALRSHVDWGDTSAAPASWHVLMDLARETPLTLQLSALTAVTQMADPDFANHVAREIPDGHALGAFVLGHADMTQGLRNMFRVAEIAGLALDFHVDESLDPDMNGLETIADIALNTGFQGPVLCGHAVSLSCRSKAGFDRIADKLARANISVVALPPTNLYLQGRTAHQPGARGLTPLNALSRAGVRVVIGSDNVRDAFCPVGQHDPLRALELGILAAHLDPPLGRWLTSITTDARTAIGMNPCFVDGAQLHDLRIADAGDPSELISGAAHKPATEILKEDQP